VVESGGLWCRGASELASCQQVASYERCVCVVRGGIISVRCVMCLLCFGLCLCSRDNNNGMCIYVRAYIYIYISELRKKLLPLQKEDRGRDREVNYE